MRVRKVAGQLFSMASSSMAPIDEIGSLPFAREESNLYFRLIAGRCEKGFPIVTFNLPVGQWGIACNGDDTLTADLSGSLMHHAYLIQI